MNMTSLNKKFGIGKELGFKENAAGIIAIEVDAPHAAASDPQKRHPPLFDPGKILGLGGLLAKNTPTNHIELFKRGQLTASLA